MSGERRRTMHQERGVRRRLDRKIAIRLCYFSLAWNMDVGCVYSHLLRRVKIPLGYRSQSRMRSHPGLWQRLTEVQG